MKNMKKALRIGIFLGILALSWTFFLLEEELAFYGIYTLIDYRVHEIAAIIPMLAIPTTVVFLAVEIASIVKKKGDKSSKWLALLFVCLIALQSSWFADRADDVSTSATCVVVEIDPAEGIIVIEKAYVQQKIRAELEAPGTFCNMLEVGETYFFTFVHDKDTPHRGRMETFRPVSEP
jgi:apolipoprotein N-acyltransferase